MKRPLQLPGGGAGNVQAAAREVRSVRSRFVSVLSGNLLRNKTDMKPPHFAHLRRVIALFVICQMLPQLPAQTPEVGQKLAEMQATYETAYEAEVGGKQ